ncbi:hypothetical protein [Rhizobium tubonense]|uniref:hypothetical protein n=1 Tax=Rhizobium tubonense TaxID=484088 RepID=UPI0011B7F8FF|nr:hypothetical protein [Rhizobium tubonense]
MPGVEHAFALPDLIAPGEIADFCLVGDVNLPEAAIARIPADDFVIAVKTRMVTIDIVGIAGEAARFPINPVSCENQYSQHITRVIFDPFCILSVLFILPALTGKFA